MMGTSIAALNRGEIQVAGFVLRRNGIEIEGKPTFDEWQEAMQYVECAATASMWWHGDMLNYGEATYGDLASEEDGDGKYDYKTLRNAKYVAQAVPLSRRRDNLSFGHHEVVAPLTPEQQDEWLSRAADDGMSRSELRKATAQGGCVSRFVVTISPTQ